MRLHGIGRIWYFEQGVGFWFCEVCKDGLDWQGVFHILEFPVNMHCNHALTMKFHGILSARHNETRLLTFCNFTCPGTYGSMWIRLQRLTYTSCKLACSWSSSRPFKPTCQLVSKSAVHKHARAFHNNNKADTATSPRNTPAQYLTIWSRSATFCATSPCQMPSTRDHRHLPTL